MKNIIVSIVVILLIGLPLGAMNFYVAPTGNDSNPGNVDRPFKTLLRCEAALVNGDTCYIRGGSYAIPFPVPVVTGEKTISQYNNEPISLLLSDGAVVPFVGSASTWETPELTLLQMLMVGRNFTYAPPPGTIWTELWISDKLVSTVFGTSLPIVLNYVLSLPRNTTPTSRTIQVRVHQ